MFPVPTGIRLLVAEYLGPHQQLLTANFVADTSSATLDRARIAFLAAAKARGFGTPAVKGETFYGTPLGVNGGQRNFLGWTVSGHAVIAILLQVKLPADRNAPTLLAELAKS